MLRFARLAALVAALAPGCGVSYSGNDDPAADMAHRAGAAEGRDMSVGTILADLAVAPPDVAWAVRDFSTVPDLLPPSDMVNAAQIAKCAMTACPDPVFDCLLFGCSGATCQNGYCIFH